jgi:hypothetical protein
VTFRPKGDHVRLDGARAQVAAAGVGQLEGRVLREQRAEEHDDRAGAHGGVHVDRVQVEVARDDDLQVAAVGRPGGAHAHGAQHVDDPVHLDDPGHVAQPGRAAVEQARAQQRDGTVLGGVDVDPAGELLAALHAQVGALRAADGDDGGVERGADPGQHVDADVLRALLDPVHRRLAGAEQLGELHLGQPAVLAGRADERAHVRELLGERADDRDRTRRGAVSGHGHAVTVTHG